MVIILDEMLATKERKTLLQHALDRNVQTEKLPRNIQKKGPR